MTAMWNPVFEWDNDSWRDRAACRHTDANLFFPAGSTGSAVDQIQAAKAVCRSCPVQDACLRFAFETNQEAGVWGGKDEDERRGLPQDLARRPPAPDEVRAQMRVDVGPVARSSAVAWFAWADDVCGDLRNDPSRRSSWPPLLLGAGGYLEQWKRSDLSAGGTFRWHAEVDPDHLEYLIHGLLQLDAQLAVEVEDGRRPAAPNEGREFYLVLVRDLLRALEMEGTGRAAFVDQVRCCWSSAAEAS